MFFFNKLIKYVTTRHQCFNQSICRRHRSNIMSQKVIFGIMTPKTPVHSDESVTSSVAVSVHIHNTTLVFPTGVGRAH